MEKLTYVGQLDDVVERYPWFDEININNVLEVLVEEILFGGPILLNDGYLVNLQACRDDLFSKHGSILKLLAEHKYLKVLSRTNGDLETLVDKMAEVGIETFKLIRNDKDYEKKYKPVLKDISNDFKESSAVLPWPKKNASAGIYQFIKNLSNRKFESLGFEYVDEKNWETVVHRFLDEASNFDGPRDKFEKIVNSEELSIGNEGIHELMQMANEAYHLNMSACLTADSCYQNYDVAVNTMYPKFFGDMVEKTYNNSNRNAEIVELLPTIRELNLPFRLIPKDKDLLIEVVNDGTEMNKLKEAFNLCKKRLLSLGDEDSITEYNSIAEEYEKKIIEHIKDTTKESIETVTKRVVKVVSFTSSMLTLIPNIATIIIGAIISGGLTFYDEKVVDTVSGSICDMKIKKRKSYSILRTNKYISESIDRRKAKKHSKVLPFFVA